MSLAAPYRVECLATFCSDVFAPHIRDSNVGTTVVAGEKWRSGIDALDGIADIGLGRGNRATQRRRRRIGRLATSDEGIVARGNRDAHIGPNLVDATRLPTPHTKKYAVC